MPYKEREIKKKYFTIGEVAKSLKLSTSQIRFWETEFNELNPKKNSKAFDLRKFTLRWSVAVRVRVCVCVQIRYVSNWRGIYL